MKISQLIYKQEEGHFKNKKKKPSISKQNNTTSSRHKQIKQSKRTGSQNENENQLVNNYHDNNRDIIGTRQKEKKRVTCVIGVSMVKNIKEW